ncbi:MAG: AAA family ATPase, partial [Clostridiales bacterium]|nr:AAA family ATPase [Clostridiales bacterium]
MNELTPQQNITLTPDQAEAEELIKEWYFNLGTQIFVLCGYAGTGKTFLIDHVVRSLGLVPNESAVFVTPTGKAASVLIRCGLPASTLHSLIYTREEDIEVNEDGEVISERFLRFVKKEKISSEIRLIVVDETSMVADDTLKDLLSFGVKCLFCGDPAQLPPVGGSNTLLTMPCITLKQIVRQEEHNPIVRLAEKARAGEFIEYGEYGDGVAVLPRREFDAATREKLFLKADTIIVGTNRTRNMINREVRMLHGISADTLLPIDGEKIICTLNNWSKVLDGRGDFHLVNGIMGTCYNVREGEDGLAMLDFQADFLSEKVYDLPFDAGIFTSGKYFHGYGDKACILSNGTLVHEDNYELLRRMKVKREEAICRFEFAYAVTCHKAQGSEYDFVIIIDESGCFENGREWLYTSLI